MDRKEIVSLGWYDHYNCGDEMFKDALVSLFPDYNITFCNDLTKNLGQINKSDFLLIGGGNIVHSAFLKGLEEVKVPYSFIGIGISDKRSADFLIGANQVFCRDLASYEVLKDQLKNLYQMPDLAFSLSPDPKIGKEILSSIDQFNPDLPTLGVFLNDYVNTNFVTSTLKFMEYQKCSLELSRFLDGLNYNILFIPMSFTPPDDRRMSLDVIGNMKNGYKAHCVVNQLKPIDCLSLTSNLDFAITMRLHSAIFCTIAGVPFLDITHHSKNKNYLDTEDLGDLSLNYYEFSIRSLKEKFDYVHTQYELIKEKLLTKTKVNQQTLFEIVKNVHLP